MSNDTKITTLEDITDSSLFDEAAATINGILEDAIGDSARELIDQIGGSEDDGLWFSVMDALRDRV